MSLSSGAHVKIGTYEYILDRSKPEPYKHDFESLFSQSTAIAGEIAKQQLRPEKLLWYQTDWSGGEGYRIFYPQQPTRYDQSSLMNVTTRGLLTTRTKRRRSAVARTSAAANTSNRPAGGSAWNKALILWEDDIIYSSNAVGWTGAAGAHTGVGLSCFDGDTDGRYLVLGNVVGGADQILSVDASPAVPTVADAFSGTTLVDPPFVTEVLEGVWYSWGIDTAASSVLALVKGGALSTASAGSLIYNSGVIPTGLWGANYWTDIESGESALYMSIGTPGGSMVFESRQDIGRPFWTSPPGFTIKKLIYHSGVLFCAGAQVASGKKFGAIWAIPLSTRSPIFIAAPRRHRNEEDYEFSVGCAGYGSQVFFGDANSGKIFVYDIEADALTLFDDLANGGTGDGMSFTAWTNLLPYETSTMEASTLALCGWTASSGVWNVVSTGTPASGAQHLTQTSTGTAVATTTTGVNGIPVSASTSYTAMIYGKCATASGTFAMAIHWWDSTGTTISTSTGTPITFAATNQQAFVTATSPSNAAYASLEITIDSAPVADQFFDGVSLHPGSSVATEDQIAFLAMHGSRLFGATWQPYGVDTSLQVFSYDDMLKENRDSSQAISATLDSSEWDYGVPQELKALNGVYVTYEITDNATTSGLVANSRITISYATDANIFTDSYTALTTMTSATTVTTKGRHFLQVSDGSSTVKFSRIKYRITLDNNATAGVAPPIVYSVVPEAQLMAYSEVWNLILRLRDETDDDRPKSRQWRAHQLYDNLEDLAQNKAYVTLLDGARYQEDVNRYTTHTVQVEDPRFVIENPDTGEGYCQVRLRAVPV